MNAIVEVRMKRQWKVRRQFQLTKDAERRWDQAYQHLLEWTLPNRQDVFPPSIRTAKRSGFVICVRTISIMLFKYLQLRT